MGAMIKDILLSGTYLLAIKVRGLLRLFDRKHEPGVRSLVVRGNEVLLVQHRGGAFPWGLPGGAVGAGEPLDVAVKREVLEETGCVVQIQRLHGIFHSRHWNYANYINVFVCVSLTEPQPPANDLEIATARYFPLTALPYDTDSSTRCNVAQYLCGETQVFDLEPRKRR